MQHFPALTGLLLTILNYEWQSTGNQQVDILAATMFAI